ncbi:HlyD family efflux transporter periplasmic adaptor subunit [Marinicella sediminis]|uniref:HlyD family efflux transporter periplasmic adaptor subunit n=1 Tax=Marinicella sediminis TaxID=1792834 RepID=A0ABV7J9S8_9GAMM|nr:HlyD family efflux transporter periplasmic adaptor subunit [Marinicella sediminis]
MNQQPADTPDFIDEYIGQPPKALIRWGISLIMGFVLMILTFSWFIDYSDTINTRVVINSVHPASSRNADQLGVVDKVLVSDGESVEKGQPIIVLQSDVDLITLQALKSVLLKTELDIADLSPFLNQHLGPMRVEFQTLTEHLHKISQHLSSDKTTIQTRQQHNHLQTAEQRLYALDQRLMLLQQKVTMEQENHKKSRQLHTEGLLSKGEVEQLHKKLLEAKILIRQLTDERLQVNSQMKHAREELNWLESNDQEGLADLLLYQKLAQQKLLDQVLGWEKQHIFKSTMAGTIALPNGTAANQNITAGQELFTIIPHSEHLRGQIKVAENGTGKVSVGQRALIQLMSYPATEFGEISARVVNQSPSVHQQQINIDVEIEGFDASTNQITTSYGKTISYIPHMQGRIEIITGKKNLLNRIFEQLIGLF